MPRSVIGEGHLDDEAVVSEEEFQHNLEDSSAHLNISGSPTHGDSFVYDSTTSTWTFQAVAGGHSRGHSIHDALDHTDWTGSPEDGQVITYDGTNEIWYPSTLQSVSEMYATDTEVDAGVTDTGLYTEYTTSKGEVTEITAWTDSTKTTLSYHQTIAYTRGRINTITTELYLDGSLDKTAVETMEYSHGEVVSINKVVT